MGRYLLMRVSLLFLAVLLIGSVALPVGAKKKADGGLQKGKGSRVTLAGKPAGQGKKTRLFILSGQSNMAGLDERVTLVPTMEKAFSDDELIFVKDSKGGRPIRMWYKQWKPADEKTPVKKKQQGSLYDRLMGMVKEASKDKTFDTVSFIWMQGEADAKGGQSAVYEESLRGLIKQLRDDLKRQDMTVVIGRLSTHKKGEAEWDAVRQAQVKVAEEDPKADWVDTDPFSTGLHYNAKGYAKLGTLFAEKTIALLKKQ